MGKMALEDFAIGGRLTHLFDEHVKDWLEQHVEKQQQQRECTRAWCLCGRKIEHDGLCWVRRAEMHRKRTR